MLGTFIARLMLSSVGAVVSATSVGADTIETSRFSELLDVARNYVGAAEFVDAEPLDLEQGPAVNFLFRSESGVLLSIALDTDTGSVLTVEERTPRRDREDEGQGQDLDPPRDGDGRRSDPDDDDQQDRDGFDRERDRDNDRDGRNGDGGRR